MVKCVKQTGPIRETFSYKNSNLINVTGHCLTSDHLLNDSIKGCLFE